MRVTGIELGPSSCVLVSVQPHGDGTNVSAVHTIPSSQAPTSASMASAVRAARSRFRFPRAARVVAWGLQKPTVTDDLAARLVLKPLTAAGFRVEAILTPAEALARLAATRPRDNGNAVAWVSINMHGAALAIVRAGEVLYSRTLTWKYNQNAKPGREQLLQRYVLVMHLAPELEHGIGLVRSNYGLKVETVVTCGNLPDLRSLTMPLIEELDLEVETLDSTDGVLAKGAVAPEKLSETASTIRLATAAATVQLERRHWFGYPAAIAGGLFLGLFMLWAALLIRPNAVSPPEAPAPVLSTGPATSSGASGSSGSSGSSGATEPGTATVPVSGLGSLTEQKTSEPPPPAPRPMSLPAVPPLTSILIADGRRLAMFGGDIVGVGDRLGPRLVVSIEPNEVVLREPSGARITVLLRPGHTDGVKLGPFAGYGLPSTPTVPAR